MNIRRWAVAAVASVLVLATTSCSSGSHSDPQPSSARACAGTACLSLDDLTTKLQRDLAGRVVGYTILVGPDRVRSAGYARTANNPPQAAMGPGVQLDIAGVGNLYTVIAVLKALTARHLTPAAKVAPFLPPGWVRGPGVATITFKELLTHRAGFRDDNNAPYFDENAPQAQIKEGIDLAAKEQASYNSADFAVLRDVLPRLAAAPGAEPKTRAAADRAFLAEVRRVVLTPAGVTDATCAPARTQMLMYPTLTSVSAGDRGDPPPTTPGACSLGGWTMTATDMRKVMTALQAGTLLSSAERSELDADCLGWDCSLISQANFRGKTGSFDNGTASLQTFSGLALGTVPIVIVTNSATGEGLNDMVDNAISEATSG